MPLFEFLGAFLGSGIAATLVGFLLTRKVHEIQKSVEERFARNERRRLYLEQALFELYGPMKMQLLRTKRAFDRWKERNDYIEAQVVLAGNTAVRDLLLAKGHLLESDMVDYAQKLIEHYDAWLEEYARQRGNDGEGSDFIFVGPKGFGFPHEAEKQLVSRGNRLQEELFGPLP